MKKSYYSVGFDDFCGLAGQGNLVPIYREILADFDTPVSAYKKIERGEYGFLFESIEGGEKWGRYSFLGTEPSVISVPRAQTSRCMKTALHVLSRETLLIL